MDKLKPFNFFGVIGLCHIWWAVGGLGLKEASGQGLVDAGMPKGNAAQSEGGWDSDSAGSGSESSSGSASASGSGSELGTPTRGTARVTPPR